MPDHPSIISPVFCVENLLYALNYRKTETCGFWVIHGADKRNFVTCILFPQYPFI